MALVSLPFGARAQVSTVAKPVQFGIAGGAALPTSDLSDGANTGYNLTGTVALNPAMIPLGIRIDGAYNRFSIKGADGDFHFTSVTGNLVYKIPTAGVAPYLIGGGGIYNSHRTPFPGGHSSTDPGANFGGGIRFNFTDATTFIEARYHKVSGDSRIRILPVTVAILF